MERFPRMHRLPPYVFAVVGDLKMQLRRQNIDVVDFSMGNPDIPTPQFIVDKMVEAVAKPVVRRAKAQVAKPANSARPQPTLTLRTADCWPVLRRNARIAAFWRVCWKTTCRARAVRVSTNSGARPRPC